MAKYKIFDIKASWPFWMVDLIAWFLISYAIYYNYFVVTTGLGTGLPLLLIVGGAFLAVTAVFHIIRWAFKKTIDGQTKQGTFVIMAQKVKEWARSMLWASSNQVVVEATVDNCSKEIDAVKRFWLDWYTSADGIQYCVDNKLARMNIPDAVNRMLDIFDGGILAITDEPFIQQSSKGPMAWATGKLMGMQQGKQMEVVWNPEINPGITGLLKIVRHEAGHTVLTALNIPDGDNGVLHHKLFEQMKYGA